MPLRIYYLDDEPDLLEMFSDLFSQSDRIIKTFNDPQEAISTIQNDAPDIFFIDFRLPGISGEEIAKKLDPKIPKVLISGDIQIESDYPFEAIFPKPFNTKGIEELMEKFAKKKLA